MNTLSELKYIAQYGEYWHFTEIVTYGVHLDCPYMKVYGWPAVYVRVSSLYKYVYIWIFSRVCFAVVFKKRQSKRFICFNRNSFIGVQLHKLCLCLHRRLFVCVYVRMYVYNWHNSTIYGIEWGKIWSMLTYFFWIHKWDIMLEAQSFSSNAYAHRYVLFSYDSWRFWICICLCERVNDCGWHTLCIRPKVYAQNNNRRYREKGHDWTELNWKKNEAKDECSWLVFYQNWVCVVKWNSFLYIQLICMCIRTRCFTSILVHV